MRFRPCLALLLSLSLSGPVFAQGGSPPAGEHQGRRSAAQHFADANTTHDGKLTLQQAMTGYKSLAKNFARIDINHRGYITTDDIKAWKAAKKAAKLAAKHATQDAADGVVRPTPAIHRGALPNAIDMSTGTVAPKPAPAEAPRTGVDLPVAPLDGGRS